MAKKKADTEHEKTVKAKDKAKKKGKKPGFFKRIGRYFKDLKNELKKVIWPTKKRVFHSTIVVIITIVLVCIFVVVLDFIFNGLISLAFGNFG